MKSNNTAVRFITAFTLLAAISNTARAATIAEWTFNDNSSLALALGSSNVASGLTVTQLNVNASFDFAGLNNVPGSVNDGYGFGGNSGQNVIFIHRADYFNGGGPVTTWDSGSSTVGSNPLSFTVTTDSLTTVTLNSLNVAGLGIGSVHLVRFQEADAALGVSPPGSNTSSIAFLSTPVVIGANQSKTFTINLNSGSLNSEHLFNTITLDGIVTSVPEPSVALLGGLGILALLGRRRVNKSQP